MGIFLCILIVVFLSYWIYKESSENENNLNDTTVGQIKKTVSTMEGPKKVVDIDNEEKVEEVPVAKQPVLTEHIKSVIENEPKKRKSRASPKKKEEEIKAKKSAAE